MSDGLDNAAAVRWLQGIITEEAGLADAEDARYLLRVVNRMRDTIRDKGEL